MFYEFAGFGLSRAAQRRPASFICEECGDMVVERYGRPMGDKKVCQACYDKALAEGKL